MRRPVSVGLTNPDQGYILYRHRREDHVCDPMQYGKILGSIRHLRFIIAPYV